MLEPASGVRQQQRVHDQHVHGEPEHCATTIPSRKVQVINGHANSRTYDHPIERQSVSPQHAYAKGDIDSRDHGQQPDGYRRPNGENGAKQRQNHAANRSLNKMAVPSISGSMPARMPKTPTMVAN
jgi:hypothetical protein